MKQFITMILSSLAFSVAAQGYVVSSDTQPVRDSSGQCVRTGSWAEADRAAPCDPVVEAPIQRIYHADVLFDFDRAVLTGNGKEILDQVINAIENNKKDSIVSVVGHADWIGNDHYNLILSRERAEVVADYLKSRVQANYRVSGVGSREPLPFTLHCRDELKLDQLIECLSPNRRVEVDYMID